MFEFGVQPQPEHSPHTVAPEELFDAARIAATQTDPVKPADVFGLMDSVENCYRGVVTNPRFVAPHYPDRHFGRYGIVSHTIWYPYDTQEARDTEGLLAPNGHSYQLAVRVRSEDEPDAPDETLLIDRSYQAFVRRSELRDSEQVTAIIPAAYSDVRHAFEGLNPELPPEEEEVSEAARFEAENAFNSLSKVCRVLNNCPEFRQAVVDHLEPGVYAGRAPESFEEEQLKEYWEADVDNSISFHKGDRLVRVEFDRDIDVITEEIYEEITVEIEPGEAGNDILPGHARLMVTTNPVLSDEDYNVSVARTYGTQAVVYVGPRSDDANASVGAYEQLQPLLRFLQGEFTLSPPDGGLRQPRPEYVAPPSTLPMPGQEMPAELPLFRSKELHPGADTPYQAE